MDIKQKIASFNRSKALGIIAAILVTTAFAAIMCLSSDAFSVANTASNNMTSKILDLAKTLVPLCMGLCILGMIFSHDEKVLAGAKKILISMAILYALLLVVTNGTMLTDTLNDIMGLGGGGGTTTP